MVERWFLLNLIKNARGDGPRAFFFLIDNLNNVPYPLSWITSIIFMLQISFAATAVRADGFAHSVVAARPESVDGFHFFYEIRA